MTKDTKRNRSVDLQTLQIYLKANLRYKWLFAATGASWLVGMVLQKLIVALVASKALDRLVQVYPDNPENYLSIFLPYIISIFIVGVAATLLIDMGLLLLSKLETKVRPQLRIRVFEFLIEHSLQFHANTFSGSLVTQANRFTNAYVAITDILTIPGLRMVTSVLIATAIIAYYAPWIALFMIVWVIFFTWLNLTMTKKRTHLSRKAAAAETVITGHLADTMGNISIVKAFASEKEELKTHWKLSETHARKKYLSWVQAIKNDAVHGLLMVVLQIVVLIMSIIGVMEGSLSIGLLLLIQVYVNQLIGELWNLSNISRNIEQSLSDAAEMTELLDIPAGINNPQKPEMLMVEHGSITFDHVNFTHADNKAESALFHDFNLHIKKGEKIGLVGHSGSGKTTLTKLLLRYIDVDDGSIQIDGQDIRNATQQDLRSKIAYVPQEPMLFHRTLSENIAYGKPDAKTEDIIEAANKAKASEFIDLLPRGYDTMVGERGVKLSGGQRQRVAIARAMLKNAPILVLDEATSALDSESEVLIQKALWKLMEGRTAIVIAHRLSTIQKMDRIIVMNGGKIAEIGSHIELLERNGIYASLWNHQSGGFLDSDSEEEESES